MSIAASGAAMPVELHAFCILLKDEFRCSIKNVSYSKGLTYPKMITQAMSQVIASTSQK